MSVTSSEKAFVFSPDNLIRVKKIIAKYPVGRQASVNAVIGFLRLQWMLSPIT
jgi:hypothetical protein